eukprot:GHVT01088851.1.p1 GENE.GHVT01088851.1~~GHVT01088851.1.p1  ORF type:complete len:159 (+),score=4.54 GHVT01088851.1:872-1348(+)
MCRCCFGRCSLYTGMLAWTSFCIVWSTILLIMSAVVPCEYVNHLRAEVGEDGQRHPITMGESLVEALAYLVDVGYWALYFFIWFFGLFDLASGIVGIIGTTLTAPKCIVAHFWMTVISQIKNFALAIALLVIAKRLDVLFGSVVAFCIFFFFWPMVIA